MKYKFCSIRINVTKYDVTIANKGGFLTPWLRHWYTVLTYFLLKILVYTVH